MKKIILITLLFLAVNVWSQTGKQHVTEANQYDFDVVKVSDNGRDHAGFRNDVNPHAMRNFIETFVNATGIMWRLSDNVTSVSFNLNQQKIVCYYDKSGNLLLTRKTYSGKTLDPLIAAFVKNESDSNYSIYRVTEAIRGKNIQYEITLQSAACYSTITLCRMNDGSLEVQRNDFSNH